MKLNYFFSPILLTITLLTSATYRVSAGEILSKSTELKPFLLPLTISPVNDFYLDEDSEDAPSSYSFLIAQKYRGESIASSEDHSSNSAMADDVISAASQVSEKNLDPENQEGGFIIQNNLDIRFLFFLSMILVGLIVAERFRECSTLQQEQDISQAHQNNSAPE